MDEKEFLEHIEDRVEHLKKISRKFKEPLEHMSRNSANLKKDYSEFDDVMIHVKEACQKDSNFSIEQIDDFLKNALKPLKKLHNDWKKLRGITKEEYGEIRDFEKDFQDIRAEEHEFYTGGISSTISHEMARLGELESKLNRLSDEESKVSGREIQEWVKQVVLRARNLAMLIESSVGLIETLIDKIVEFNKEEIDLVRRKDKMGQALHESEIVNRKNEFKEELGKRIEPLGGLYVSVSELFRVINQKNRSLFYEVTSLEGISNEILALIKTELNILKREKTRF